ncbi:hypothetical protein EVAR_9106_1 [Eumeta japonica]|uniref:Uncharacterized protein n=1 Tax=Eumeta variegata TaxID=151549 RepID=A0A4C1TW36_EUMVA|nr:hypothetical protein EVAR_9106_1 [Eumeta japonica]
MFFDIGAGIAVCHNRFPCVFNIKENGVFSQVFELESLLYILGDENAGIGNAEWIDKDVIKQSWRNMTRTANVTPSTALRECKACPTPAQP